MEDAGAICAGRHRDPRFSCAAETEWKRWHGTVTAPIAA